MKKNSLISAFAILTCLLWTSLPAHSQDRSFFQIKTYHFDSKAQQQRTDRFLEEAYLPALHRAGISSIGVFHPINEDTAATRTTYVLIPFQSLEQFAALSAQLEQDPAFATAGEAYLQAAYDNPPYERIASTLIKAFEMAPSLMQSGAKAPKTARIYELRSYESATEELNDSKVHMFNEGGEIAIFDRLNFHPVFYGNVISGDRMPNLMYMTSFRDMESRNAHWKQFGQDSHWKKISAMDRYQHNVSHADIHLLHATSFSDI